MISLILFSKYAQYNGYYVTITLCTFLIWIKDFTLGFQRYIYTYMYGSVLEVQVPLNIIYDTHLLNVQVHCHPKHIVMASR